MSREINLDFQELREFLNGYDLSLLLANNEFLTFISQQHKKFFSYLTAIAEFQNYVNISDFKTPLLESQFSFIKESCSDSGIAFFSSFHGSYKASKLIMRSSIETFLKGFNLDELPGLNEETSMYELFRHVKSLNFYSSEPQKSIINSIHHSYKKLCADVHTASEVNMANISALNYFPSFEESQAKIVANYSLSLIPNYLTLLCLKYNEQFHHFHYNNTKIIMLAIPKGYRPRINNVD